ncbi:MAG: hypothetical protein WBO46_10710 [Caldilineaceae bacterium]
MKNRPLFRPALRPVGLFMLLLASLALTVGLIPRLGLAAPAQQSSPLRTPVAPAQQNSPLSTPVSPLGTPVATNTATPSPTPTATSPVPPTAEPPTGLQSWPTPTPTPYAPAVQSAIDALTADEDLGVSDPEVAAQMLVIDPASGDEWTVVRLTDGATGTTFWVRTDEDGESSLLPDFSEDALALVAERDELGAADLEFLYGFYIPFPFTHQILWTGQFADTKAGGELTIALNLAGEEVDPIEESEAESAALLDYCGAMDVSLCLEILSAPAGAESNVVLTLAEEISTEEIPAEATPTAGTPTAGTPTAESEPETAVDFLDRQEVIYREEDGDLFFRLENDSLRELAQMDGIESIQKDFPDEHLPLDTNLILGLIEESGALSLTLESQKTYPLLTYQVEATLEELEITRTQSVTFVTQINGIFAPADGPASQSPALATLPLGELSGRYGLSLAYGAPEQELDLTDNYILIVSDGRAVIRPVSNSFTWASYPTWLRLPATAVWFVVQARAGDTEGKPFDVEPEAFADKAQAFYTDIEALRARELSLAEGVYTNVLFVPPWPTWQIPDGDFVRVPLNGSQSYIFKWPDIRYYTYSGGPDALEAVIAEHCVDEVAIVGYTASGGVLDVCQP